MNKEKIPITVADGDGIGPEIMTATLKILEAAKAPLQIHKVDIGEKVYLSGQPTGIHPETWDTIRQTKAFLKAPITTPQGGGFKSLNVTIRTTLGLYANVRPCISYDPFVATKHPVMDVVIIRENEEDLYTGIEYRQTQETFHALKIITRPGCEKIIRYAFEYARANHRKKVTCFSKDNILKLSDGLFHKIFDEIAKEYPEIENEHWIIDIGAAKLAATPEIFDVIVMANLYGDILSDVAAQITGSVGLAGSANIGKSGAMFEAIHGSAARHAGKNSANPSGLILAAVMMLVHIGLPEIATTVHNAWLKTIEDGVHTHDIFNQAVSKELVGTQEFADAVIARLGQKPKILKEVSYGLQKSIDMDLKDVKDNGTAAKTIKSQKKLVGIDVFIDASGTTKAVDLHKQIQALCGNQLTLTMIANRGVMVWPVQLPETSCADTWRCRIMAAKNGELISHKQIAELLHRLAEAGIDFIQTEHLYTFDGQPGYTLAQNAQ